MRQVEKHVSPHPRKPNPTQCAILDEKANGVEDRSLTSKAPRKREANLSASENALFEQYFLLGMTKSNADTLEMRKEVAQLTGKSIEQVSQKIRNLRTKFQKAGKLEEIEAGLSLLRKIEDLCSDLEMYEPAELMGARQNHIVSLLGRLSTATVSSS